jgi:hypothetical protein
MFGKNVDFIAVFFISLVMLGFAQARSWNWPNALDSIRFHDAIEIDRCPVTNQVLSSFSWIFR